MIQSDLFQLLGEVVNQALLSLAGEGAIVCSSKQADAVRITLPPSGELSDFCTNAALVLARENKLPPRDLARQISERMQERHSSLISLVEVSGPGFINISLTNDAWRLWLTNILKFPGSLCEVDVGEGQRINVEYVSANPTGPLHVAHARSAVVGDALANILQATNFQVTREYYINDGGSQIDKLARSAYLRYREALGEEIGSIPEGLYPGEYLCEVGTKLLDVYGSSLVMSSDAASDAASENPSWFDTVRDFVVAEMMSQIRRDLNAIGINHDIFASERALLSPHDVAAEMIDVLRQKDLVYVGTLPPPKNSGIDAEASEQWQSREQLLFRSSQFGDEVDRPLIKPEGGYTYFGSDVAYHYQKLNRGADHLIDVLGADHGGYVSRISAASDALSGKTGVLSVVLCQMVRLFRGGEAIVMSKRSGQFVTLRQLIDEVGADPVRYMMLFRKADAPLDFDLVSVREKSRDNPVFYVQYAHARIASVMRHAATTWPQEDFGVESLARADFSLIEGHQAVEILRSVLARMPATLRASAVHREPHRMAFYAHELAGALHALWTAGKSDHSLRFVCATDLPGTRARLGLLMAVMIGLKQCLDLVGVSAPDELTDD